MENKTAVIINDSEYTYVQLYSAVQDISKIVGEAEKYIIDIKDTFTYLSAVLYAVYTGKEAVIFDNCWPESYKKKLLTKFDDKICILTDNKCGKNKKYIFNGDRNASSYPKFKYKKESLISFPIYYFGERQFHEVSAEIITDRCQFIKNILKIELGRVRVLYADFKNLMFIVGVLLANGTVIISDNLEDDNNAYDCVFTELCKLDELYESVKSGGLCTRNIITYGDSLVKTSETKRKLKEIGVRNYNFYDMPYYRFITSVCDDNSFLFHKGKTIKGVSACILNDGGGYEANGISGYVSVSENNNTVCTEKVMSADNGQKMYLSGYRGKIRNDGYIYFDNTEKESICIDGFRLSEKEFEKSVIDSGIISEYEIRFTTDKPELYYVLKQKYSGYSSEWLTEYISSELPEQYKNVILTKCASLSNKKCVSGNIIYDLKKTAHNNGFDILAETDTSQQCSVEVFIHKDSESFHKLIKKYLEEHILLLNTVKIYECKIINNGLEDIRNASIPFIIKVAEDLLLSDTEKSVLKIYKDILGKENICMNDSFFECGGDSVKFIKLCTNLSRIAGYEVSMMSIMKEPTPENCVNILKRGCDTEEIFDIVDPSRLISDSKIADKVYSCSEESSKNGAVLLTGCTGFIGSFILKSLLETDVSKIYCLVRADSEETGLRRLYDNMKQYCIEDFYDESRIKIVPGNLERHLFGLTEERFNELSEEISVIYHNGAKVDFLYTYNLLKTVNVDGTFEMLKFAVNKRNKVLNYISSAAVLSAIKGIADEYTDISSMPPELSGYNQSKWVSDVMITRAIERNIKCNIFRLGTACGASESGCCQIKDFAWLVIKMCINVGYYTDFNIDINLIPVDKMAEYITVLGNNNNSSSGIVYHIFNNKSISISNLFQWITEYGYHIEKVPFDIWCIQIENYLASENADEEMKTFYSIIHRSSEMAEELSDDEETEKVIMKSENTVEKLRKFGIEMCSVNKAQFFNNIHYFIKTGFLKDI